MVKRQNLITIGRFYNITTSFYKTGWCSTLFTPTSQKFYTDISAISVTFCNSDHSLEVVMLLTMIPSMFVMAPICFKTISLSLLPPTLLLCPSRKFLLHPCDHSIISASLFLNWHWVIKHCKSAKLPWHHNSKISYCLFVFWPFCLFVFLSFSF